MSKDLQDDVVQALVAQKETKGRRSIYKVESDEHRGELLAADLDRKIEGLKTTIKRRRVEWDNLEEVQSRCLEYMAFCRDAQTIPTVSGLAVFGLGVTRQALNLYLREHPNTATAQFLTQVKDTFSDVLETSALNRNIDSVMAIFTMKNDHNRADRLQLEPITTEGPLGPEPDQIALEAKIEGIVID